VSWFRRNWRKVAGWTCAAGTVALAATPYAAAAAPLGALCAKLFSDEYHEGQRVVEAVHPALRAALDAVAAAKRAGASAEQLRELQAVASKAKARVKGTK